MDSRERVLTALEIKEPDRVPTHVIALDANNVDKVLGKPEINDFQLIEAIKQQYPDNYAEKLTEGLAALETEIFSRMAEASWKLGFDAIQVGIIPYTFRNDKEFIDPWGRIWEIRNNEGNAFPFYREGLITSPEVWEEWNKPDAEKLAEEMHEFTSQIYKKYNDKIFLIGVDDFIGIFESTWQSMGIVEFSRQIMKNPSYIKERFEFQTNIICELIKASFDAGLEVWTESGDLAWKSGTFMRPEDMRKYLLPCYKRMTKIAHDLGGKCILHSDGNLMGVLDFIVDAGFDGLHSLDPMAGMDLAKIKQQVGDKLCLLGNIDVSYTLSRGSQKEVEAAVKKAIQIAGSGGGFIVSPTNIHPAVKPENLRWMVEATKKYGAYPIKRGG
nr:uroporphyrinogen decarboxylase family protein [Candidatus Freyarchaeota archaeon]